MVGGLVSLIVLVIIVGIVLMIAKVLLDKIPMDGSFKQIAWLLMVLVAVLIVVYKALPMIGVSI